MFCRDKRPQEGQACGVRHGSRMRSDGDCAALRRSGAREVSRDAPVRDLPPRCLVACGSPRARLDVRSNRFCQSASDSSGRRGAICVDSRCFIARAREIASGAANTTRWGLLRWLEPRLGNSGFRPVEFDAAVVGVDVAFCGTDVVALGGSQRPEVPARDSRKSGPCRGRASPRVWCVKERERPPGHDRSWGADRRRSGGSS